jgi:uncharacterized membrane protein (DUF4010 family)
MGSYILGIFISIGIGFIFGSLSESFTTWLPIVSLVAFILFLGFSQFSKSENTHSNDLTTDLALITTFVLGIRVSGELYRAAVVTPVVITTIIIKNKIYHRY